MFYLHCQIEIMLQSTLNQRPRVETVVCLVNVFYVFEIDDLLLFMVWYEYRNCMGSLFIYSFILLNKRGKQLHWLIWSGW